MSHGAVSEKSCKIILCFDYYIAVTLTEKNSSGKSRVRLSSISIFFGGLFDIIVVYDFFLRAKKLVDAQTIFLPSHNCFNPLPLLLEGLL